MSAPRRSLLVRSLALVVLTLVGVVALVVGARAADATESSTPPAGLRLVGVRDDPDALVVTVRNDGAASCQAVDIAAGTVSIPSLTVDGRTVDPELGIANADEPLDAALRRHLRPVAPGATLDVRVPIIATPRGRLLTTVSLGSGGVDPQRSWFLPAAGRIDAQAAYGVPAFAGAPADVCTGTTETVGNRLVPTATVEAPQRLLALLRTWWPLAVLTAGLVLVVVVVLAVRRRRRAAQVVAASALVLAMGVGVLGTARPAHAQDAGGGDAGGDTGGVQFDPGYPADARSAFATCLGTFKANGDPAGVLSGLDLSKVQVVLPTTADNGENSFGKALQIVYWNPKLGGGYVGDPGVERDPCSSLYHELFHATQGQQGKLVVSDCYVDGQNTGIATKEVEATRAQNLLRGKLGLPLRTVYGGTPLPPDGDPCEKPPKDDKNNNNGNGNGNGSGSGGNGGGSGGGKGGKGSGGSGGNGGGGNGGGAGGGSGNGGGSGGNGGGGGAGGPKGGSNGDPHITTFDGNLYDFQTVGEFTAARADGLEIQVRQTPLPGSRTVSVNTAMAFDVAGDHLTAELAGGEVAIRRDGALTLMGADPVALPHGGRLEPAVERGLRGVRVVWPDATGAVVTPAGRYGLVLLVELAPARAGKVEGFLATAGPKTTGAELAAYADRWRVGSRSLFTYGPGQSTDTFTDRSFPDAPPAAPTGDARAAAEAVCRSAGVADGPALEACVLDVGLTGEASFSAGAARTEAFVGAPSSGGTGSSGSSGSSSSGTTPRTPPPVELHDSGSARLRTGEQIRVSGHVDEGNTDEFTITADAGQIAYMAPGADCHDETTRIDVVGPDGVSVGVGVACIGTGVGRVELPVAGDYKVRASGSTPSDYSVTITGVPGDTGEGLRFGTPVTAVIPAAGAKAKFRIDVKAGGAVFYEPASDCKATGGDGLFVTFRLVDGSSLNVGGACTAIGRTDLRDGGTLEVEVAANGDASTGRFSFTVYDVPPDGYFTIRRGDTVSPGRPGEGAGRIEERGSADRYVLEVNEGETFSFVPPEGCRGNEDLIAEVRDPGGSVVDYTQLCQSTEVTPRQSGAYVIRVFANGGSPATGDYAFTIR